jgi:hypothetical protein
MKMPTACPICKEVLMNEFRPEINKNETLIKTCNKRIGHKIMFISHITDHNIVTGLELEFRPKTRAMWVWLPTEDLLSFWISKGSDSDPKTLRDIPAFEPDLSNYRKLVNKIKTYMTFS